MVIILAAHKIFLVLLASRRMVRLYDKYMAK